MDFQNKFKNEKNKQEEIRIDRLFAQSDIKQPTKEIVRVINGKRTVHQMKQSSPNMERINDAMIWYFQKSTRDKFNYYSYRDDALEQLSDKFTEYGLNRRDLSLDEKRIRAAAIQQTIDKIILKEIPSDPVVEITFDNFLKIVDLKSVQTFKDQVETIKSVLNRAGREVRRDDIDIESMKIEQTTFSFKKEIISVDFVLDEEMGRHFPKFDDYVKATVNPITGKSFRNKRMYVKKIVFSFSRNVIPHIVCQGIDYVSLFPKNRSQFKLQNTYNLDIYLTSIQHAQEYRHLTDFTPEQWQIKTGHNYTRFDKYMNSVLNPSIEDFNAAGKRKASYLVKLRGLNEWIPSDSDLRGRKIEKIRWVVENFEESMRDDIDARAYYIALKSLHDDIELSTHFESIRTLAITIEEQINNEKLLPHAKFGDKLMSEWLLEADYELETEKKVISIIGKMPSSSLSYSEETMSLRSDELDVANIIFPSGCYAFLMKNVDGAATTGGSTLFPADDINFISFMLNESIRNEVYSPIHFVLTIISHYVSSKKSMRDWKKVFDSWLKNGKYETRKERGAEIIMDTKNGELKGVWNYQQCEFDTGDILLRNVDVERIAQKIAQNHLRLGDK